MVNFLDIGAGKVVDFPTEDAAAILILEVPPRQSNLDISSSVSLARPPSSSLSTKPLGDVFSRLAATITE